MRRFSFRSLLPALVCTAVFTCAGLLAQNRDEWRKHVSAADKARTNALSSPNDIAAGGRLYGNYCARCHGTQGQGVGRKPAITGPDVTQSTDGELFWLLRNGSRGMPSWTTLPEPQRWQIIAYVRSLAVQNANPAGTK